MVVNGSKLIWSRSNEEFRTIKLKQGTQFAQRSNGIDICLAFFLHGKSNLCIAQNKEDICKPSCKLPGNVPDSVTVTVFSLGMTKYV